MTMREVIGWLIIAACFTPPVVILWNGYMSYKESELRALYGINDEEREQ